MKALNSVLKFLEPYATKAYWKYILVAIFAIGVFCILFYLHKNAVISNAIKKRTDKTILRQKELRKNIRRKEERKFDRKLREKLIYSGLSRKLPFITPENWVALLMILFFAVFVITLSISKHLITSMLIGVIAVTIALFAESLMAFSNYRKTDKCMVEFLNLLGNYSSQNTEITSVLEKIYKRVDDPLQTALKECIYESESLGVDKALVNLASKIEHPKFKEIVQNIRISIKHSSTFRGVVENNNQNLADYIKLKKETEQLAVGNFIQLVICAIIGVFIVYFCGKVVNLNLLQYIKEHTMAQIECFVAVTALIYAGWQVYSSSR